MSSVEKYKLWQIRDGRPSPARKHNNDTDRQPRQIAELHKRLSTVEDNQNAETDDERPLFGDTSDEESGGGNRNNSALDPNVRQSATKKRRTGRD